jgi:hypothetical protein
LVAEGLGCGARNRVVKEDADRGPVEIVELPASQ